MSFFRPKEDLGHRRLVNAANALVREERPSKYQMQRLVEIWEAAAR